MIGKCPGCGNSVTRLDCNTVDLTIGVQSWHAVTYNCPTCHTVLGCQIDPIALRSDIVAMTAETVVKRLRERGMSI